MLERELVGRGRALRADRGPRAPVITRAVRALAPWLWPYFSLTTRGCGRTGSGAAPFARGAQVGGGSCGV